MQTAEPQERPLQHGWRSDGAGASVSLTREEGEWFCFQSVLPVAELTQEDGSVSARGPKMSLPEGR